MNDLCNSCQFDTFTKKCQKGWERNGITESCDDYTVRTGNKVEVSRNGESDFDIYHEYRKLDEENAELKKEIEKMRNCQNCKWNGLQLTKECGIVCAKNNKEKWELAE